ncbi:cation:proton antiporter [Pseudoxanthomonas wuyuanensis]
MDSYKLALTLVGLALLGAAWLPHLLKRQPLTFPMLYVGVGVALYALPLPLPPADPIRFPVIAEHLTELAVLVALVGAGLRIDTVFGWRRWRLTWRLLAITMPLTIAAGAVLGQQLLGYGVAAAMLLGAVLAPTDPVLASDVQVHAPGKGGEDPVRFALTSEAGLNDGLAFPFVWLAVALAVAAASGDPMQWQRWLLLDALWRVLAGTGIGWLLGYALMHLIFRSQRSPRISAGSDGLIALAITLFVYGVAELCGGYGFLAVFVAALVVRQHERSHEYHTTLNLFAEQCERLLMALLLILFGGALVGGLIGIPSLREWGFALAFVLVARPLAGWLGMAASGLPRRERWTIAVFGVRGIGSLYYLAFAINHAHFPEAERLWSVVSLVVLLSILLHGISAKPVMGWLDGRRKRRASR